MYGNEVLPGRCSQGFSRRTQAHTEVFLAQPAARVSSHTLA